MFACIPGVVDVLQEVIHVQASLNWQAGNAL